MQKNVCTATGTIDALAINGIPTDGIYVDLAGPIGDVHYGFTRQLGAHDSVQIRTSNLTKGATVFNWRSWTGLSAEEVDTIAHTLGYKVPVGILLENMVISGVPNFSQLPPSSRLVFPKAADGSQAILTVWEENGPCKTVGERLEALHQVPRLTTDFIRAALGKRGVMGFVLSAGPITIGDTVQVYPPVT